MNGSKTPGRFLTLLVTNAIKIGGLTMALVEFFTRPSNPNAIILVLSGFMMAGAQGFEDIVLRFAAKMFADTEPEPTEKKP